MCAISLVKIPNSCLVASFTGALLLKSLISVATDVIAVSFAELHVLWCSSGISLFTVSQNLEGRRRRRRRRKENGCDRALAQSRDSQSCLQQLPVNARYE